MPVKIPQAFPAFATLSKENIFIISSDRAMHQDIRPLRIAVLNLMPTKIVTETQILRLLGNTALQIDVYFIRMESHECKNTASDHLDAFYEPLSKILSQRFDGLIITGAPVENLPFDKVDYWQELCTLMDWAQKNVWSTLYICWGAQAGLFYHYGINKYSKDAKVFGIFTHSLMDSSDPIVRGFDDMFPAPHSRHTEVKVEDIAAVKKLKLLAVSDEAGVYLAASQDRRKVFVTGHPEYDRLTLRTEYERDKARGLAISKPAHYFPDEDVSQEPCMSWRAHAHLLYANWLNYCVYQETPYNLEKM